MSKEEPTKKQLSYHKSLCRRYNIEKTDTKELSKLDMKNLIENLIEQNEQENKAD